MHFKEEVQTNNYYFTHYPAILLVQGVWGKHSQRIQQGHSIFSQHNHGWDKQQQLMKSSTTKRWKIHT